MPTTTTKTTVYENFNAHFAAAQSLNHLNSQLAKTAATRAQSPQTTKGGTFFQVPDNATTKSFTSSNSSIQQSCIVSTSSTAATKDYRVPQAPPRAYITSPNSQRTVKQPTPTQIQTKAQTKVYSEINNHNDRQQRSGEDGQSQSSPISFSIMDAPGRVNYAGSNSSAKRSQQYSNYRHYPQNSSEQDFQRPKSGSDYNSSGPDCNVVVPRRPSPLQAHSQASPLGHAPSPAYPMYNSPMNSISSPQQTTANQLTPPSPLDVSVPRPTSQTASVAYPSVITRAALNTSEKTFPERYERQASNQNCWDDRQNQSRKFQAIAQSNTFNGVAQENQQRLQQNYFDTSNSNQVALQDLSSCRGDPMSIVKNLQQQQSCQVGANEVKQEVKPQIKRRKSSEGKSEPSNRIPPPAHNQTNGAYFEYERWNLPPATSKMFTPQTIHQQQLMVPHPHGHHPPPSLPYFPPFHLPPHPTEFSGSVELAPMGNYLEQNVSQSGHFQEQHQQEEQPPLEEEKPKVVVPNIEEELNFLSQSNIPITTITSKTKSPAIKEAQGSGPSFINSYLKFLQGDRDSPPPPLTRGNRKQTWNKSKPGSSDEKTESNGSISTTPSAPAKRLSQGDPQDDPRYFPLPKERKRNSFESDSDGLSSEEDFFLNTKKRIPFKDKKKPRKVPIERKRPRKQTNKEKPTSRNLENIPRRESSKRAAKERSNFTNFIKGDDDLEEPLEFQDSDSDPAWTPQAKEDGDEIVPISKKLRKSK